MMARFKSCGRGLGVAFAVSHITKPGHRQGKTGVKRDGPLQRRPRRRPVIEQRVGRAEPGVREGGPVGLALVRAQRQRQLLAPDRLAQGLRVPVRHSLTRGARRRPRSAPRKSAGWPRRSPATACGRPASPDGAGSSAPGSSPARRPGPRRPAAARAAAVPPAPRTPPPAPAPPHKAAGTGSARPPGSGSASGSTPAAAPAGTTPDRRRPPARPGAPPRAISAR